MKSVKIVISDFHLGTGRILGDGAINTLEEFYYDEKFAELLNYYSTGIYADHEVELIINGDFLNLIGIDYRGHYLTVLTESISLEKIKRVVHGHQVVFAAMKKFAQSPNHLITYVVGNHDQEMLWPAVRLFFNEAIGASVRYKNIVYFFDGVHIEHGHMYQFINRFNPKRFFLKKNVAEPILNLPFGSHFFVSFLMKVKDYNPHIDKIRPLGALIKWGLIQETVQTIKTLVSLLFSFAKYLVTTDSKFKWSWRSTLRDVFRSDIYPDLTTAARKILDDDRVHTVIFGHSHVYRFRQFDGNKTYLNSGTWTEATSLELHSLGKQSKLTYICIEYPDEAQGRPRCRLKEWHGYHRIEEDVRIS
jgi:UDP-2,3-diacylglucosamine pyrophosphatase LpxH